MQLLHRVAAYGIIKMRIQVISEWTNLTGNIIQRMPRVHVPWSLHLRTVNDVVL